MILVVLSDGETYSVWEDHAAILEIPNDSTDEQIDSALEVYKTGAFFNNYPNVFFSAPSKT